ncbi:cbb3-type cytochrome c oxidase N-terminal domain-containing protein [Ulvibacter antarcticus]|uniref:Cytochrome c oxidase cbb3-type subunit 3 n=1 Tax=Ulvibacter antarcticus TaxID=442714 RepID=A0A3L9YDC7_9FLAO|nr:cbb3-type cytochrome c oxidase N-terminal domain-containing protein [Ulvibacter antarcticus]RMA58723.1 cytochrome c oxidase cbb3-type subunit 3 [Ulvibacter antarcticus]
MRTVTSFLRISAFMIIAFIFLEFLVASEGKWAIIEYPILWMVLLGLLLFAMAIEVISEALKRILFAGLKGDAKARFVEAEALREKNRFAGIKTVYIRMLGSKPMESEEEIVLDHNYDGIRELDNTLPPWWKYMFYASIVFAFVYMLRYHVFDGVSQTQEYENELAEAKIQIEEYKKTAKDLIDINTVELLTDASDINAGKAVFAENCIACHKADGGGGIGPNLTDNYWILGGGIKNVFNTISEGGRDGKGMVSWKSDLKPSEMAQVASYLLTFKGTTPAEPKEAEGELWVDEAANEIPVIEDLNEGTKQ